MTKASDLLNTDSSGKKPGLIGCLGYIGFETIVQKSPQTAQALSDVTGISEQALRHQGSDFFGAAALANISYGVAVMGMLNKVCQKYAPKKIQDTMTDYYTHIRTGITFASLIAFEKYQSVMRHKPLDTDDIMVYGLGLTLLSHGQEVISGISDTISSLGRVGAHDQCRLPAPSLKKL